MQNPKMSVYFESKTPSGVRLAQMRYDERQNKPETVINVSQGNVPLPANPALQKRLFNLGAAGSPFEKGIIKYSKAAGEEECRDAFLNILACEGFDTKNLHVQVTDGGSSAMEIMLLGVCGPAGSSEAPLLLLDPAYTNYIGFAKRVGRKPVTVRRTLKDDGHFSLPSADEIEQAIRLHKPGALLVIPYDNPTGQLMTKEQLIEIAELCVKYNIWMVSDEAYRELYYTGGDVLVSVWGLSDKDVPGIEGRRISIETASKVWNACGLRIGALITDNKEFSGRCAAEYTNNLCPNVIGQYIFAALVHETKDSLTAWYNQLREYYKGMIIDVREGLLKEEPRLIVSSPDASIYTLIDVRNVVKPGFDCVDFALYCAEKGEVDLDGVSATLLLTPMKGFYVCDKGDTNPGTTQFRISFVQSPEVMGKVPKLFVALLRQYEALR